jgi:hypothetical protein
MSDHKSCFDKELLYRRKQVKFQWLHNSSQMNGDNMNDVRLEKLVELSGPRKGNV